MATIPTAPPESRVVIENVRWETYEALADERRGSVPRMTYDEGVLELLSPLRQHENLGRLIGRVIETYSEVKEIEILSVASITFKRKDLQKRFEADESYYVTHADIIRPKEEVDLRFDPPPDLVIEVEITSSAIKKLRLFAAMQVPEVWRHDGERLEMFRLVHGVYQPINASEELPGLGFAAVMELLSRRFDVGESALFGQFRQSNYSLTWEFVRSHIRQKSGFLCLDSQG